MQKISSLQLLRSKISVTMVYEHYWKNKISLFKKVRKAFDKKSHIKSLQLYKKFRFRPNSLITTPTKTEKIKFSLL